MSGSPVASSLQREQERHRSADERIPLALLNAEQSGLRIESGDESIANTSPNLGEIDRVTGDKHRGFDGRIPISLSHPKQSDDAGGNHRREGGNDKAMNNRHPVTPRRSSPSSCHSSEDPAAVPPKNDTGTEGRVHNDRDEPNEHGNDSTGGVGRSPKRRVRFATSIDGNIPNRSNSSSGCVSVSSRNETGGLAAANGRLKEFSVGVEECGLASKKRQRLDGIRNDPISQRRTKRPAKHSRLSPSAVASSNKSDRGNSVSHQAKGAQTSSRQLQHHSRHSSSIFADDSSSCEETSSINNTQNPRHDSSFPLNLGSKDTSAVELPEADAQQYVRISEDDQALEEKGWEYDELVGYYGRLN